jgi:hypothetical protein
MAGGTGDCKARKDAITHIGYAFHAISDSASLSHSLQNWGGVGQSLITGDFITHVEHETRATWTGGRNGNKTGSWPKYWKDELIASLNSQLMDALNNALKGCQSLGGAK